MIYASWGCDLFFQQVARFCWCRQAAPWCNSHSVGCRKIWCLPAKWSFLPLQEPQKGPSKAPCWLGLLPWKILSLTFYFILSANFLELVENCDLVCAHGESRKWPEPAMASLGAMGTAQRGQQEMALSQWHGTLFISLLSEFSNWKMF